MAAKNKHIMVTNAYKFTKIFIFRYDVLRLLSFHCSYHLPAVFTFDKQKPDEKKKKNVSTALKKKLLLYSYIRSHFSSPYINILPV